MRMSIPAKKMDLKFLGAMQYKIWKPYGKGCKKNLELVCFEVIKNDELNRFCVPTVNFRLASWGP